MLKKSWLVVVLLGFMCSFAVAQEQSWYKDKEIVGFRFNGLKVVSSTDLLGLFSKYKGKKFTDELYFEMLQMLYELDYFTDIQPEAIPADPTYSYVKLEFTFVEKPFSR